jgi:hypothetical protein
MPETLGIGLFVLGAVLILIALVGGKFKIFVAEVSPSVTNPFIRVLAFGLGVTFIFLALNPAMISIALAKSTDAPSPVPPEPSPPIAQPTQMIAIPTETSLPPTFVYDTPVPARPNPAEFVAAYWQNVSAGRYEAAWAQLSPGFRQTRHSDNYSDYVSGYQQMSFCRIEISNINIILVDTFSAVVQAHLTYYTGAQCTASEYDFEMWLIYDGATTLWLFDKNFIR